MANPQASSVPQPPRPRSIQWDEVFNRAMLYLAVAAFLFVVLLPFYWIFMSSITPKFQMFSIPPRYWPAQVTLDNYVNMSKAIPFFQYFTNSLLFALGTSFVSVALAFLASYALARLSFPGASLVFMLFILSIAIPQIGTVVPIFEMFKHLNLVNNRMALIMLMSSLVIPFTVWIMVPFIQQIPSEIEEAATMDGARLPQMLWHVVVPVMRPALATMLIINFIISWNELLYPLVFATSRVTKTLSVGLVEMAVDPNTGAGRPWDLMSSLSVTMIIPVLILVLLFQRLIISGLTRGAVK